MKPRKGREVRTVCSVRVEPKKKAILIARFGSVQKAFDWLVEEATGRPKKLRPQPETP